MTFNEAKKLQNKDEVMIKKTKEIVEVTSIEVLENIVVIHTYSIVDGFEVFTHQEVE